jgi:hypothetical protein
LKKLGLTKWGAASLVLGVLLSGCKDPGPASAATNSPQGVSGSPGSATLSWEAPSSNTNGSALTDLAGYRIYYGINATDLSHTVEITSIGMQTYVIDDLGAGTWYFAITAVTSSGAESTPSNIVTKTVS